MTGKLIPSLLLSAWALSAFGLNAQNSQAELDAPAEDPTRASVGNRQQLRQHQTNLEKILADVEQRYGETAASLYSLRAQAKQKQQQMEAIRRDLQKLENSIDREQKSLAAQIKAAYKMGKQEQLKLLLNQQDPALSGRMLRYYQYLTDARLANIKAITRLIADLDIKNQQIQTQNAELEKILQQKQSEQDALARAKQRRNELLSRLSDTSSQERLAQLKDSEAVLKNLLVGLPDKDLINDNEVATAPSGDSAPLDSSEAAAPFVQLKGKLRWPAKGRITQKFGSPRLQTVWDGILIAAPEGTEVHAVADGEVTFAKWFKGFGYLMVIKHDQQHMTLYGYNQGLFKHKNDRVRAGEVIAAVGQSGGRTEPGLYFSIRKQGLPIDPTPWCKK